MVEIGVKMKDLFRNSYKIQCYIVEAKKLIGTSNYSLVKQGLIVCTLVAFALFFCFIFSISLDSKILLAASSIITLTGGLCVYTDFLISLRGFMGISLLISTTSGIFAYVVCYDQNNDLLTYSAFFVTVGVFWFMISLVANNKIAKTANEVFSIFFGLIVVIKDTILDFLPEELNIDQYINFAESGYSDAQVIKMLIDVIATPLLVINAIAMILCVLKEHWIEQYNDGKDLK